MHRNTFSVPFSPATPISPPSGPDQWLFQGPLAESKFLATILDFLAQLSLMSSVDGEPTGNKSEPDDEKVTLSSIHQAKGLEWKAVFLIWLVDGQFPNGRILEAEDLPMLEEERRLFYVALTRAKDDLYLTYPMMNPKSYSGDVICRPSR